MIKKVSIVKSSKMTGDQNFISLEKKKKKVGSFTPNDRSNSAMSIF